MNNGDFPGCMKPVMPAGNICEEGLKRNSELSIEKWQEGFSLSGTIAESWIINGRQFFISSHYPEKIIFMGVLCARSEKDYLIIAQKLIESCNCKPIINFPCFGEIYAGIVTMGNNKSVAFLSIIRKVIYLRERNQETEEKLIKAVEMFEKEIMPKK